jgi:hypothetical protein
MQIDTGLSTGLPALDEVLKGLIPGDNIVWQVDTVEDYRCFTDPYIAAARRAGHRLVYFRFARHEPLVEGDDRIQVVRLDPAGGFENFVWHLHQVIERCGRGTFYVFDCISDLAECWYSDLMLGNLFMLTCPYLYDLEAIAVFGMLRHRHSFHATGAVAETTQILLDAYRHKGRLYVHPWKVQARFSPTMHMLHLWDDQTFRPVSQSGAIAEVLTSSPWVRQDTSGYRAGIWNHAYQQAAEALRAIRAGQAPPAAAEAHVHRLLRMAITREPRVLELAERYLTLEDLLGILQRMIGTGLIGGKAVGMLLARAILRRRNPDLALRLEPHDSFYVGSDVFYTFLVRNGMWWTRQKQRDPGSFLEGAVQARRRLLVGEFPQYVHNQFEDMLDYFGQSPIICRSSSLLEDNFGNAFAGKYESVFCANQGPRRKRLEDFLSAVRTIYASAMGVKALTYRAQRGLLDRDEQMALLVQRVSGALYGQALYYPQLAGVGFSVNPYVWSEQIDPQAGMVRLVFGLGTRAVNRTDDDYTRVVALNAPDRRPEANFDEVRQYAQRRVDVIDLEANRVVTAELGEVLRRSGEVPIDLFASRDRAMERRARAARLPAANPWVLTFQKLFDQTGFVQEMRAMLAALHEAYDYPVDVEFTANFFDDGTHQVNLLQCRPLQIKGGGAIVDPPASLSADDVVLRAAGAVVGQSRVVDVDRLVYVAPAAYADLSVGDRHAAARLIGRVTHLAGEDRPVICLVGPGRWGTTTPSLGVPVQFADINTVSVLCEVVAMSDTVVPDVSLGTHFFSELVELDMLYFAVFPAREGNGLNRSLLEGLPNRLPDLLPDAADWAGVVRVIEPAALPAPRRLRINANALKQRAVCYFQD